MSLNNSLRNLLKSDPCAVEAVKSTANVNAATACTPRPLDSKFLVIDRRS
jgi:hypothetical protein